jgi:hypothetical protein
MSIHTMSEREWQCMLEHDTEANCEANLDHVLYHMYERLNMIPSTRRQIQWSNDSIAMQLHCVINSMQYWREFGRRGGR